LRVESLRLKVKSKEGENTKRAGWEEELRRRASVSGWNRRGESGAKSSAVETGRCKCLGRSMLRPYKEKESTKGYLP